MAIQPRLLGTSGPLQGQALFLASGETSVGRGEGLTITIDHMSVSRLHCSFIFDGENCTVRDNGSTNGTLVNGIPVDERVLQHGDRVSVGSTTFLFLLHDDEVAPPSRPSSEVTLTDVTIENTATMELRSNDASYLHPMKALAGADIRAIRAFDILVKLSTLGPASLGLQSLQAETLRLLMEEIPSESGAIILTGGHADRILSKFGRRQDGETGVEVSQTVLSRVLKDKTALLTNQAPEALPEAQSLIHYQTRSLLCVPLLSGDRIYGAIYLTASRLNTPFDEFHLQLLTAAAALLAMPLERARQVEWLTIENQRLLADVDENHRLIGSSPAMKKLYDFISRAAPTDSTILIRGESGTGKELVAHAIHANSSRAKAPFVVVNCAALKGELLESELFGHEKGAFTSAIAQKKGKFEIADGGTIFLDEVAELAPELQVKILRVLQEFEFERIGSNRPIKVSVRVIAATDRDLEEAIRQGRFRHELYYRLNVLSVETPPLRRRVEDIVPLANHFARRYASRYNGRIRGISPEAEVYLKQYSWPGNVRELQNAIERAVVLGDSEVVLPEDLPECILDARTSTPDSPHGFHNSVREAKRQKIQNAIDQASGNIAEAARLLGVNRTYLHKLIRNLGLTESEGR
jgi:Nif-specific regulatory protein